MLSFTSGVILPSSGVVKSSGVPGIQITLILKLPLLRRPIVVESKTLYGTWKLKSAEEEETAVVEQEREETTVTEQESVSVPVSPSDTLRMYFQADGMLNEAEIPKVTKALEVSVDILYYREKYSNGMVISSALIIWKGLICIIESESPVVVVLSGSMEPGFK
ncbi:hypothetical protein ES332_D12G034600v1 [Gossypium tomentosum]|uniref:Uncharacterized protein n=1 Tax=Gossypium tomentosum TaxID=34277 RepID=A0A5D2I4G9_GOSTO|nr:hypothetical protein ES332_D12G034600v1 [Gossypium tomentosum]